MISAADEHVLRCPMYVRDTVITQQQFSLSFRPLGDFFVISKNVSFQNETSENMVSNLFPDFHCN